MLSHVSCISTLFSPCPVAYSDVDPDEPLPSKDASSPPLQGDVTLSPPPAMLDDKPGTAELKLISRDGSKIDQEALLGEVHHDPDHQSSLPPLPPRSPPRRHGGNEMGGDTLAPPFSPSCKRLKTETVPVATTSSSTPQSAASRGLQTLTVSSGSPDVVCAACLGMLGECFVEQLAECVAEGFRKAAYTGVKTFCIAITIPLSLLIRHTCIGFSLKKLEAGSSREASHPTEGFVKEELRARLRSALSRQHPGLSYDPEAPLRMSVVLKHKTSGEDCHKLADICPGIFKKCRTHRRARGPALLDINAVSIKKALETVTLDTFESNPEFASSLCLSPRSPCSYEVSFEHKPVFVAGRYNKFSRTLPQTPWILDGERKAESSVQELICGKLLEVFCSCEVRFSSSGREDVDVRMLGRGRPFLVELLDPKNLCVTDEDLAEVETVINASTSEVAVQQLKIISKQASVVLKEGEEEKTKCYSAVIWTSQEITPKDLEFLSEIKDLVLHQKTPIRVLHRRSLATRERMIYTLQGEIIDSHHFKLTLSTQAGTYIKEFVHGDFGRTQPSLRDLLKREVDILSLDVDDVMLEWPP